MATALRPPAARHAATRTPPLLPAAAVAAVVGLAAAVALLLLPDITVAGQMMDQPTHYMALLMNNQPWNLLLFMAVPFAVIYLGLLPAALGLFPASFARAAVAFLAVYFTAAAVYLVRYAAWPLTDGGGWRGLVDMLAVGGYIATAVPILILAALTFGGGSPKAQTWWAWVALVVAHAAMVFGMMAPFVLGWGQPMPM